jgi:hypothetical protein
MIRIDRMAQPEDICGNAEREQQGKALRRAEKRDPCAGIQQRKDGVYGD